MKGEKCSVCGKIIEAGEGGRGMCERHYQADQNKKRYAAKLRAQPQAAIEAMHGIANHLFEAEVITEEQLGEHLAVWTERQQQLLDEQAEAAQTMIEAGKAKRLPSAQVVDATPDPPALPPAQPVKQPRERIEMKRPPQPEHDSLKAAYQGVVGELIDEKIKHKRVKARINTDPIPRSLVPGIELTDKERYRLKNELVQPHPKKVKFKTGEKTG